MLPRFEFERVTRANDWIEIVRSLPASSPLLTDHRLCRRAPSGLPLCLTKRGPRLRPATTKSIGLLIATHARPDGTDAWPGIKLLEAESSRDRVTAMTALGHLEAVGLLLVRSRANRPGVPRWHATNYCLAVPSPEILVSLDILDAAAATTPETPRDWFTPRKTS